MLWWWSGRQAWATRWASRTGVAFGVLLVALGLARALGGEMVGGLWFVLIGLFLQQAARASLPPMRRDQPRSDTEQRAA
jgi:hypothetical protein